MRPASFFPHSFGSSSKSLLRFELNRVSREGRLNLQAARAMAEQLCGYAGHFASATTLAAEFERASSGRAFTPPVVAFGRPIPQPF